MFLKLEMDWIIPPFPAFGISKINGGFSLGLFSICQFTGG